MREYPSTYVWPWDPYKAAILLPSQGVVASLLKRNPPYGTRIWSGTLQLWIGTLHIWNDGGGGIGRIMESHLLMIVLEQYVLYIHHELRNPSTWQTFVFECNQWRTSSSCKEKRPFPNYKDSFLNINVSVVFSTSKNNVLLLGIDFLRLQYASNFLIV